MQFYYEEGQGVNEVKLNLELRFNSKAKNFYLYGAIIYDGKCEGRSSLVAPMALDNLISKLINKLVDLRPETAGFITTRIVFHRSNKPAQLENLAQQAMAIVHESTHSKIVALSREISQELSKLSQNFATQIGIKLTNEYVKFHRPDLYYSQNYSGAASDGYELRVKPEETTVKIIVDGINLLEYSKMRLFKSPEDLLQKKIEEIKEEIKNLPEDIKILASMKENNEKLKNLVYGMGSTNNITSNISKAIELITNLKNFKHPQSSIYYMSNSTFNMIDTIIKGINNLDYNREGINIIKDNVTMLRAYITKSQFFGEPPLPPKLKKIFDNIFKELDRLPQNRTFAENFSRSNKSIKKPPQDKSRGM